ncbi:hypothetical protein M378DRAFT_123733 [Amanita muscaria Koide BX008]|uniref:Uncharacterized protein n=1 Tax=Amanita muscaria (strain Koide BX008) TaxID=946122 RepID=A0A0C2WXQ3_AMAMK|nr:hypothetical protein M378DRAFT_123733 [Amanita muscaria Koide BX008]
MVTDIEAKVIALAVQAIMFGLYLATLAHCLRWLVYEDEGWKLRPRNRINWVMLGLTLAIFAFSTADLSISLRMVTASIRGENVVVEIILVITCVMESTMFLMADAILILRCWAIYNKLWRIIFLPLLFWFTSLVCTTLLVYWTSMSILDPHNSAHLTYLWWNAFRIFWASRFATNFYSTGAIIWQMVPLMKEECSDCGYIFATCRAFAESGILYTITSTIILLSVLLTDGLGLPVWLLSAIDFSMAGIVFNLILIRVGQHRAWEKMRGYTLSTDQNSQADPTLSSSLHFRVSFVSSTNHSGSHIQLTHRKPATGSPSTVRSRSREVNELAAVEC